MKRSALLVLPLLLVRCHAARDEQTADPPATPTGEAPQTEEPTATADGPSERAPLCAPALRVPARVLATQWVSRLGQRVVLRVRAVRTLAPGESLVVSEGERFVVLAPPRARLDGMHTFVLTGSATVALAGHTRLPELLLDDCSS